MSAAVSIPAPPPPSVPPPANSNAGFSVAAHRAFNDALEKRYPAVEAERTAKRIAAHHREAREYLRRVRRGDRSALDGAVESLLAVSELRGGR